MKNLLLVTAACLTSGAMAAPLTPDQALARMTANKANIPAATSNRLNLVKQGAYEGMTAYYVFSNNKRAYILSANDLAVPVLGYIDRPVSADTEMPPQLKWWLENCGAKIKAAQEAYGSLPQAIKTVPRKSENRAYVAPMINVYWNQNAPYNNLCPTGTYTGCVATAMAQVMKYYNYPECGTGTVSTEYDGNKLSMNLGSTQLDWANMLPIYTDGNYNSTQATAVATLMKACGYSVQMNYGTDASGTHGEYLPKALATNFKYDAGTNIYHADYFSPDEWEDMLYTEVSEGRPVLYAGDGQTGGHQFVCDGYQEGNFHFNWGWGGAYDGFFVLNHLVPAGQGIGGNGEGFNENQSAVIGIRKPVSGSKPAEAYMMLWGGEMSVAPGYDDKRAIALSAGDNGYFCNFSGWDGIFDIAFKLTDNSNNKIYYHILEENNDLPIMYGFAKLWDYIPETVPNGTYTVELVHRISGSTEWKDILIPYATPTTVTATLTSNRAYVDVKIGTPDTPAPEPASPEGTLTFSNVRIVSDFYTNSTADVMVNVSNGNTWDVGRSLTMMLLKTNENGSYKAIDRGNSVYVTVPAGQSKDYTFSCPVGNIEPGAYFCGLVNNENRLEYVWDITVKADYSGVSAVTTDENTNVEYYDLQGQRIQGLPTVPGIYVRRVGTTANKVIIN